MTQHSRSIAMYCLALFFTVGSTLAEAQVYEDESASQSISIRRKPKYPPALSFAVKFSEPSGNNYLDAEETGTLDVTIKNTGKGKSSHLKLNITLDDADDLRFGTAFDIPDIDPERQEILTVPISAAFEVQSKTRLMTFLFSEANGFEPSSQKLQFSTRKFLAPQLTLVEGVDIEDSNGNGKIEPGEIVKISIRVVNKGAGKATDVRVKLRNGENVFFAAGSDKLYSLGTIQAGASADVSFSMYTNNRADAISFYADIEESYGRFGKSNIPLPLFLNKVGTKLENIVIEGKKEAAASGYTAESFGVDIESNIPVQKASAPYAVALIIGIRDYTSKEIPKVEFAKRDAQLMREYLVKVMGYDPKNILPQNPDELMTVGAMKTLVRKKLPSYLRTDGSSDIFVYYAGHGAPSTETLQPFFVPSDCDPNDVNEDNAYKMVDFYADIAKTNARKKMVVIDACFSGQNGDGTSIIKNASPVLLKVSNPLFASKDAIVFQSSASNQVSNWYPEKKHGMFTYFFLKGLKGEADLDKNGTITVDEMERYINDENNNLPYVSRRECQRPQQAVVTGDKAGTVFTFK